MPVRLNTILLIDDSEEQRDLYKNIFRQSCLRIISVSSAELDSLDDILRLTTPFFVLVDYQTVHAQYAQFTKILHTTGATIPNAIVTTTCDNTVCQAFDYAILKPFTAETLNTIVGDILNATD